MTKAEKTERNMRVVLMCNLQVPRKEVAESFEISDRQVRRIMADWRKGSIRGRTELAVENVNRALKTIKDDMEALGIAATNAGPEERIALHGLRMEQLNRNFSVLRDAGVSFEGLYERQGKDLGLVADVNKAFRTALDEYGVDREATDAAIEASMEAFAEWGYEEPGAEKPWADVYPPETRGGQNA